MSVAQVIAYIPGELTVDKHKSEFLSLRNPTSRRRFESESYEWRVSRSMFELGLRRPF